MSDPLVLEPGPVRVTVGARSARDRDPARPAADPGAAAVGGARRGRATSSCSSPRACIAAEELERPARFAPRAAAALASAASSARSGVELRGRARDPDRVRARRPVPFRIGAEWEARAGERFTGLGARHGEQRRPAGRASSSAPTAATPGPTARPTCSTSAASRRATTRPCRGCIASRGYALWLETDGDGTPRSTSATGVPRLGARAAAGPLRLHVLHRPHPGGAPAALPARSTGCPPVLPEWGYGHWKSRDVYEHQATSRTTSTATAGTASRSTRSCSTRRGRRNTTPGSPTRTSSPTSTGMVRALPRRRRAHGRVGHAVGEPRVAPTGRCRPTRRRARCTRAPASNYEAGARGGPLRPRRRRRRRSSRAGGWAPARRSTSPRRRPRSGGASRPSGVLRIGVEGIKADDGEGYYFPADVRFADGRSGARGGVGARRCSTGASMQRALDEVHPGARRAVRALRLDRPAGARASSGAATRRRTSGRCETLVAATLIGGGAAASRTGRTTSAATSATGSSSAAPRSCCCAGCSSAASRR